MGGKQGGRGGEGEGENEEEEEHGKIAGSDRKFEVRWRERRKERGGESGANIQSGNVGEEEAAVEKSEQTCR